MTRHRTSWQKARVLKPVQVLCQKQKRRWAVGEMIPLVPQLRCRLTSIPWETALDRLETKHTWDAAGMHKGDEHLNISSCRLISISQMEKLPAWLAKGGGMRVNIQRYPKINSHHCISNGVRFCL